MKRIVKGILQGLSALASPVVWKLSGGHRLVVLMYHRVLPDTHSHRVFEEPGMYVSPATLRMHLRVLPQHFALVHLDDWIRKVQAGEDVPRLACAITFDDGWRDNYEYAFPVLREASAPACIFLVSDFVGSSRSVWTTRLSRLLVDDALSPEKRDTALSLLQGSGLKLNLRFPLSADALSEALRSSKGQFNDYELSEILDYVETKCDIDLAGERDFLSWDEVREMSASGLVRFGSHTRHHVRLTDKVDDATLENEVVASKDILAKEIGYLPSLFCYPNGDYTAKVLPIVGRSYAAAVTTQRGWNDARSPKLELRRVGLHEDISRDARGLLSRVAGFF